MEHVLFLLMKPSSIATIIFPFCLCAFLIGYEIKDCKTDVKYFLSFPLVLLVSYYLSVWSVVNVEIGDSVYTQVGLHIPFLFFIALLLGHFLQWKISYGMATILSYLQIFIIDVIKSFYLNLSQLLMDNGVDVFTAHQMVHDSSPTYTGIGGAGFSDALFLAILYPVLVIKLMNYLFPEKKKTMKAQMQ
jgi:hypothetical protein